MNANDHWKLTQDLLKDQQAVELLRQLNFVANVWDDIVDGDGPVPVANVNAAFEAALIHIPRNPFYRKWQAELQPLIEVAIAEWHAANEMQASGDPEQVARAHVLRFGMLSVWVMCGRLIGGTALANEVALAVRREIPYETLEQFREEMAG